MTTDRVTIAFLASGIEGIKVRLTARGDDAVHATTLLAEEESLVRALIEEKLGDIIFGVDEQTMEDVVAARLLARGADARGRGVRDRRPDRQSHLVAVAGASTWFRGGVVSYASDVKYDLLQGPGRVPS